MSNYCKLDWREELGNLKEEFVTLWARLHQWHGETLYMPLSMRNTAHLDSPLSEAGIRTQTGGAYMMAFEVSGDTAFTMRLYPYGGGGIVEVEATRGEKVVAASCYLLGGREAVGKKGLVNEFRFEDEAVKPIMLVLVRKIALNIAKVGMPDI